ncbi:hypothetical protein [Pantoea ananatis]|uniref:hypothetical protein n=1 Tax=Pantoea ananas TaxID=553 RepID=UPI0023504D82|nr:hypothetical protein [Pantoea ananatis]MDC7861821.1 hypothetical protein [Pantoea ananatis]
MKLLNISTSAAIIIAGLSSHAALAELTPPSTQTVEVSFAAPLSVSNELTAVSNLQSGSLERGTSIATGQITTTAGSPTIHYIAMGTPGSLSGTDVVTIHGENDSTNTIDVALTFDDYNKNKNNYSQECSSIGLTCGGDGRILYEKDPINGVSKYVVYNRTAQTVNTDTYSITTTAYGWVD